ncbi:WRKY transcription factor 55-like [Triticum dicoccoides]|uniref:WRKY transcription factor 55-like n=1 Tax=Triticum dicoccoides TaxID=85692 RepID=UPI00188FD623|nr:WRKY transcription factor 55-like [Triticum dicoccoides]
MAMRPKSEMSPPPSDQRGAVIEELRKGAQLADRLRQQLELIPELGRRSAALASVSNISTALVSSASMLESNREQYGCSSPDPGAAAYAAGASGNGGGIGARNGAIARTRKAKHRRGPHGEELPIKGRILTETPENDGFHWRKYGEKKILNAVFPRSYYRCGYSDEHRCPAKKLVQQQNNNDPPVFMVTLINDHTCSSLFPANDQPPSSSNSATANSQVLDFTKASLSSAVGLSRLKKEEDAGMSVTVPSYTYEELASYSSLPLLSPKEWEMEMEIKSLFRHHSGGGT